jgi:hypothetical protein
MLIRDGSGSNRVMGIGLTYLDQTPMITGQSITEELGDLPRSLAAAILAAKKLQITFWYRPEQEWVLVPIFEEAGRAR